MRAALAMADGFFAVHPQPPKAISDQDSQLYLSKFALSLEMLNKLFQ